MKMSKLEGLQMLKLLDFPTIELIDPNLLDKNSQVLKQGLSVRTSPKKNLLFNTNLPSIHNCTDLEELRKFIQNNEGEYHIIVHRTVKAQEIGSVSRLEIGTDKVIIELFDDFEKREQGIIKNRVTFPIIGEKFRIDQLQIEDKNEEEYKVFTKVIKDVKYIPFKKFDAEFVVEDGKVFFMDLTIQGREDSEYAEELIKKSHKKKSIKGD